MLRGLAMPNDSVSGFSDVQQQQIREIAQQAAYQASSDAVSQVTDSIGSSQGAIVSGVSSAFASAIDSRSGVVQVVTLSDEQWDFLTDSLRYQNTSLLFSPLLVASVVGVLVFMLFSDGFRHG